MKNLLYKIFIALTTKGLGITLQVLVSIVLGRVLGAYGMGIYGLLTTTTHSLAVVANAGLPLQTLKTMAHYQEDSQTAQKQLYKTLHIATYITLFFASIILLSFLLFNHYQSTIQIIFPLAILGMIFSVLGQITIETLKGLGKANIAVILESSALPGFILLATAIVFLLYQNITIEQAISFYILGLIFHFIISFILGHFLIFKKKSNNANSVQQPVFTKNLISFWLLGILDILVMNFPVLIASFFMTTKELGAFIIAYRLIGLVSAVLVTLSAFFAPKFAQAATKKQYKQLRQYLFASQIFSLIIYLPAMLLLGFFSSPILNIFGEEFVIASLVLQIMIFGQFIHAATGLSGVLLTMTGHESIELIINIISTLILIISTLALAHYYGMLGIALGFTIGVNIKKLFSYLISHIVILQIKKASISNETT